MALQNLVPRSYRPEDANLVLGGVEVFGYAEDSFITVAKAEDLVMPNQGVMGDVVISGSNHTLGTITITIFNNSPMNKILSAWVLSTNSAGNAGYFPVIFNDESSELGVTTYGWIQTQPDYNNAKEVGSLDWVIGVADARLSPIDGATVLDNIVAATI